MARKLTMSIWYMTSNIQPLLGQLYSLQRLGIKTGLEHTLQLLAACGNPHLNQSYFHVAGTNGKGSTSAFLFSILRSAGLKVGLYTSPHLVRFNERIRVDGIPIPDEKIAEFMELYNAEIKKIESTFFETTTVMAFWYFRQNNVDMAVIETGLGGRLDATNVINPLASVITSISLDHQEILGKDLQNISLEKAGIIKHNVPVISCRQNKNVEKILKQKADEIGSKMFFIESSDQNRSSLKKTSFSYKGVEYSTQLTGEHQIQNSCLAIETIIRAFNKISVAQIQKGISNALWPGRFQLVSAEPPVIYDVAHNEQGIQELLNTYLKLYKVKPVGLLALKKDKDISSITKILKNQFNELMVFDADDPLLNNSKLLSEKLKNLGVENRPISNINEFIPHVSKKSPGIIFGSHYIAGTVYDKFQIFFDKGII